MKSCLQFPCSCLIINSILNNSRDAWQKVPAHRLITSALGMLSWRTLLHRVWSHLHSAFGWCVLQFLLRLLFLLLFLLYRLLLETVLRMWLCSWVLKSSHWEQNSSMHAPWGTQILLPKRYVWWNRRQWTVLIIILMLYVYLTLLSSHFPAGPIVTSCLFSACNMETLECQWPA